MKYFNLENSLGGIIGLCFHQEALVARVKYAIILCLFSSSIMFVTKLVSFCHLYYSNYGYDHFG